MIAKIRKFLGVQVVLGSSKIYEASSILETYSSSAPLHTYPAKPPLPLQLARPTLKRPFSQNIAEVTNISRQKIKRVPNRNSMAQQRPRVQFATLLTLR